MIWARDLGPTKVSKSSEYFVYWGLFEMNCWGKRSDQIAKGEFLEVPCKLRNSNRKRLHIRLDRPLLKVSRSGSIERTVCKNHVFLIVSAASPSILHQTFFSKRAFILLFGKSNLYSSLQV